MRACLCVICGQTVEVNSFRVACCLLAFLAAPLRAQENAPAPIQSVAAIRFEQRAMQKQRVFVARIDLRNAKVEVRVARGGADPDGDGPWQTTLQPLSLIAAREHFDLAINGDFFSARNTVDAEGAKSGFVEGKWASAIGPAVTDGFLWARPQNPRPVLMLDADQNARILAMKDAPDTARQIIAGSDILLQDGKRVLNNNSAFATNRHPRTAVGLADAGKTLVLVVVDGRDAPAAIGMSLGELTDLMLSLNCTDTLNLDGGGSSEMILRDANDGKLRVLNQPSDGRERAVANVLGVSTRGSLRVPEVVAR